MLALNHAFINGIDKWHEVTENLTHLLLALRLL